MRVGDQRHAPVALLPGKTRYPSYRKLGGPQARSGGAQKMSPHRDSNAGPSSPYRVAIPTELSRPSNSFKMKPNLSSKQNKKYSFTRLATCMKNVYIEYHSRHSDASD